jgi:hypothetical protein
MSRSYREPWIVDGYGSKRKQFFKRLANRRLRRTVSDIADGKAYRKFFESWSICDFKWFHDPKPRIRWRNGVMETIQPDPEYRIRCK